MVKKTLKNLVKLFIQNISFSYSNCESQFYLRNRNQNKVRAFKTKNPGKLFHRRRAISRM